MRLTADSSLLPYPCAQESKTLHVGHRRAPGPRTADPSETFTGIQTPLYPSKARSASCLAADILGHLVIFGLPVARFHQLAAACGKVAALRN